MRLVCLLIFVNLFCATSRAFSQELHNAPVEGNAGEGWMIYKNNSLEPWTGQRAKAIYLQLPAFRYKGYHLKLRILKSADIFVNEKMVLQKKTGTINLPIDSLAGLYSSSLTIAVFQKDQVELNFSSLVPPSGNNAKEFVILPRRGNFFLNFSILAVMALACSFVLLFRTNPKLTLDYLNIFKLFSIQGREDNLLTTRVTSSVNLLFYLFCSACCALSLLIIFYFGADDVNAARYFTIHSAAEGFLQWTKLISIIGGCIVLKLALIYTFSTLFKLRDTAALQFFNFIRMLFLIVSLIALISLTYFIYYGYPFGPNIGLIKMSLIVMSLSVIMVFLKLMTFLPFRFFHLFSYLCASEIIPLVILLRVLLY